MTRLLKKLYGDDCGALLATEWVVVATLLVLGLIPALIAIRQGTLNELFDFSNATASLDQSYEFNGQEICVPDRDDSWWHGRRDGAVGDVREFDAAGKEVVRERDGRRHDQRILARTWGSKFIEPQHNEDGKFHHTGHKFLQAQGAGAEGQVEQPE